MIVNKSKVGIVRTRLMWMIRGTKWAAAFTAGSSGLGFFSGCRKRKKMLAFEEKIVWSAAGSAHKKW